MIQLEGKTCKDCKIFTYNIEEEALALLHDNILSSEMFRGAKVRIMPDVHAGKGIVIGFTCPINKEKPFVAPSHVGVDIGCGIESIFFDKPLEEKKFPQFERKLKKEIPTGFNINKKSQFEMKDFFKFLNHEIQRAYQTANGLVDNISFSNEQDLEKWCQKLAMDYGTFVKSIGSLGGGNHFCEYDTNEEEKKYAFTVHTGSRNLGQHVFRHWNSIASGVSVDKAAMKKAVDEYVANYKGDVRELPEKLKAIREKYRTPDSNGYLGGTALKGYLTDMVIAQAYASYNRHIILQKAADIMEKINGAKVIDKVSSVHNYIDFRDLTIRKGAIRSYEGEKMIIPFNMRDGMAICDGKSNEDWNCSAPHGSGRAMSRSKAKKNLNLDDFKKQMEDAGIYTTSVCANTLDEAPDAYKPTEEIIDNIKDTCDVLFFMKPKINIKATDEGTKYGKKDA